MYRSTRQATEMLGVCRPQKVASKTHSLIRAQGLDNLVHIHKLDLRTELDGFSAQSQYMRFKLVVLDAGLYKIFAGRSELR